MDDFIRGRSFFNAVICLLLSRKPRSWLHCGPVTGTAVSVYTVAVAQQRSLVTATPL